MSFCWILNFDYCFYARFWNSKTERKIWYFNFVESRKTPSLKYFCGFCDNLEYKSIIYSFNAHNSRSIDKKKPKIVIRLKIHYFWYLFCFSDIKSFKMNKTYVNFLGRRFEKFIWDKKKTLLTYIVNCSLDTMYHALLFNMVYVLNFILW